MASFIWDKKCKLFFSQLGVTQLDFNYLNLLDVEKIPHSVKSVGYISTA